MVYVDISLFPDGLPTIAVDDSQLLSDFQHLAKSNKSYLQYFMEDVEDSEFQALDLSVIVRDSGTNVHDDHPKQPKTQAVTEQWSTAPAEKVEFNANSTPHTNIPRGTSPPPISILEVLSRTAESGSDGENYDANELQQQAKSTGMKKANYRPDDMLELEHMVLEPQTANASVHEKAPTSGVARMRQTNRAEHAGQEAERKRNQKLVRNCPPISRATRRRTGPLNLLASRLRNILARLLGQQNPTPPPLADVDMSRNRPPHHQGSNGSAISRVPEPKLTIDIFKSRDMKFDDVSQKLYFETPEAPGVKWLESVRHVKDLPQDKDTYFLSMLNEYYMNGHVIDEPDPNKLPVFLGEPGESWRYHRAPPPPPVQDQSGTTLYQTTGWGRKLASETN
ncbi:hypothetical protein FRC11_011840 [Ceratobasidium sp. 423]|nr:hypothetical protein FRC11_011840 [Ceratobasidium sp. 423]